MNALRQHIQIAKFDAYKKCIESLREKMIDNAQKVVNTLTNTNQVPPEALITLESSLWQDKIQDAVLIISQEWLSKQAPLAGFFEEGQSLSPSLEQTDDTKRQCWEDNGVFRYNELGSQWTLQQLGARVPSYDDIIAIYKNAHGTTNAEKIKNMGVVATGWRGADGGRVERAEFAYLRSSSPGGDGDMLTAWLHPGRSDVDFFWFKSSAGVVPFGVMDKKVPA